MNLANPNATWKDGQEVTGQYYGIPYRGRIADHDQLSRRTPDGRNFIFHVDLIVPIVAFGIERTSLHVWSNSPDNTIFA